MIVQLDEKDKKIVTSSFFYCTFGKWVLVFVMWSSSGLPAADVTNDESSSFSKPFEKEKSTMFISLYAVF